MHRTLVTGANRGLGLEFVRQLLARGDNVIAACRDPAHADALHALAGAHPGRMHLLAIEMADENSIAALARQAAQKFDGLDLLINNAGRNVRGERFGAVAADGLNSCLQVNAIGTFLLTQALAPLLVKGERAIVANISSQLASIARTDDFHSPSYAISKAALNMATVLLARAFSGDGVRVVALNPGWVRTDMGGASAPLSPNESVAALLRVIDAIKPEDSGTFVDYQGLPVPW